MQQFLEKHYKIIISIILAFIATVSLLNAYWDSAIFDETAHIGAAYSYVTEHEIRLNPEHPPLIKDLAGLPLLFLNLNFDTSQPFWLGTLPGKWDEGQWFSGRHLLYQAGNNPDKILFWSRFPIVLLSLLLGWLIFRWTRELAGTLAGLFALTLYAFDPNILGHNHFVTTDLGIAAFVAFSFYFYLKFIKSPTGKNVILAGIFVGLLMLTKFSFITVLPLLFLATVLYPLVLYSKTKEEGISFKLKKLGEYVGKGAIIFAISLVVVWSVYAVNTFRMTKETVAVSVDNNFSPQDSTPKNIYTNKTLHWLNSNALTRPLTEFGIGIGYVFRRVSGGNGAYFMGNVSGQAFPAYFPTVFILKEPLLILFSIACAIFISLGKFTKSTNYFLSTKWEEKIYLLPAAIRHNFTPLILLGFIILYSYISITGNLNIGFRHLFPILPFIYILVAVTLFNFIAKHNYHTQKNWYGMTLFLSIILMAQTVSAYPYYMSYFNRLAGGSYNGYHYVTDSNADWGQDLKRLKIWLEEFDNCASSHPKLTPSYCEKEEISLPLKSLGLHGLNNPTIDKIRVNYFGGGDVKYYLGDRYIDWWDSKRPIEPGFYAISTNFLQGSLYDKEKKDEDSYRWINKMGLKPIHQVGTSILIYYVRTTD